MRLTQSEIADIKRIFLEVFESGNIYLFGSRVDDAKKGGDIDLYIDSKSTSNRLAKKINFLSLLKQALGDQKIDVILSKDKSRLIEKEALENGIKL